MKKVNETIREKNEKFLDEFEEMLDQLDEKIRSEDNTSLDLFGEMYVDEWLHSLVKYARAQAERAQELEREIKSHAPEGRNYTNKQYVNLLQKNKRYREALEFYANEKNYEVTGQRTYIGHGDYTEETWIEIDLDRGQRAREALGNEKWWSGMRRRGDNHEQTTKG